MQMTLSTPLNIASSNQKTYALQAIKDRKSSITTTRMPSQTSHKTATKITPPTPML
jgi:hypothetical protein